MTLTVIGFPSLYLQGRGALAELPREYLEKYFQPCERGYEPVKALRDCVVFARQDVTADPPFLRVDLVSCRNVMIYFNASLQAKVLSVLHYALREPGLLFLGRSETVTQKEELFAPLDRRNRIYKPRKNKQPASIPGRVVRGHLGSIGAAHAVRPDTSAERSFLATLARHYASAGMLVDGNGQILHSHGNVSRFMEFPTGTPELNLTRLVVSELRQEALTTLHRAQRKGAVACSRRRRIASLGGEAWRMRVIPAAGGDPALFAVVFENSAADGQDDAADSALPVAGETEAELSCMDTCTPINEIPTLLSGSQINRPQFVGSDTLGGAKIGGKAAAPLGYRAYKPGHVFQGPDGQRYIVPGGEMKPFRWTKLLPYGGAPVPREGDEMPDWLHSQIMADLCQASS